MGAGAGMGGAGAGTCTTSWTTPRPAGSATRWRQVLTLVPTSAQLELTLPLSAQLKLTASPIHPNVTRGRVPEVLKLSSDVSDVSRRSSS